MTNRGRVPLGRSMDGAHTGGVGRYSRSASIGEPKVHAVASTGRPASILVVDDDRRNRALLRGCLHRTYDVVEAESGPEALELLARRSVDLVLLDVTMPGMSGFDVCREVKRLADGSALPVLMLTALRDQEARNAGLEAGADDFLSKPVDRRELTLRVGVFLRLREQAQTIQRQFEELRLLDSFKDDLVSLIVHDLRNPLAAVLAFLNMFRAEIKDAELRADVVSALGAAGKVRETLDDMLQVRLLEEGRLDLSVETLPIADLMKDAVATVEPAANERSVAVTLALGADPVVPLDRKLVRRAVENMLSNAVKYSPTGETVDVGVRATDEGVEIAITDRGPGVPEALRTTLFEKFGSVELARGEARRGHGLGLYLVKLVATAHGGRVIMRSRDGGGSVFGLWFPLGPSQA